MARPEPNASRSPRGYRSPGDVAAVKQQAVPSAMRKMAARTGPVVAAATATRLAPVLAELRIERAARPLTDRWQQVPVEHRGRRGSGSASGRCRREALGLDPMATLATLLDHPFQLIRLGAYWNRIGAAPAASIPASSTGRSRPPSRPESRSSCASARSRRSATRSSSFPATI